VTQSPQSRDVSADTVRLVVSSFVEAMHAFEGERFQQQLAEVACVGLSWILEDRLAGVNVPEWPVLCEELLANLEGATPDGFAQALRGYSGFGELSGAVVELADENKIDLAEVAAALRHAGDLARRVAALRKQ